MAYIGASPAPLATAVDSNAVETGDIQNSAVTTAKIADAAVTNAKIDTVAASKLTGALPAIDGSALTGITVPTAVSQLTNDSGYLTSSTGVTTVNGSNGAVTVQPTLVSGTNIKTVNGTSLLGSGNITAGASTDYAAVGTYVFGVYHGNGGGSVGNTYSGSSIYPANILGEEGSALSGTWRAMGRVGNYSDGYTRTTLIYCRVS